MTTINMTDLEARRGGWRHAAVDLVVTDVFAFHVVQVSNSRRRRHDRPAAVRMRHTPHTLSVLGDDGKYNEQENKLPSIEVGPTALA